MDPHTEQQLIDERRHLIGLCFRMLGTVAEAEDAVQETYARWYRLTDEERAAIEVPIAWLTRVASRVCLDQLGSARARRERYVGEWLPEPVPSAAFGPVPAADPQDRVTLDESVSTALLVVLDAMTPAERVAFVLHDVFAVPFEEIASIVGRTPAACRQLASSARHRVQGSRRGQATRAEHDRVARAFADACATGDLQALVSVLDGSVVLRSDGGGVVSAARNPVFGSDKVARFLLGALAKWPREALTELQTDDGLGYALWDDGRIVSIATLRVVDGVVSDVWMMLNPGKLSQW